MMSEIDMKVYLVLLQVSDFYARDFLIKLPYCSIKSSTVGSAKLEAEVGLELMLKDRQEYKTNEALLFSITKGIICVMF